MTTEPISRDPVPPSRTRQILTFVTLAVLGGGVGAVLARAAGEIDLPWPDEFAASIAVGLTFGTVLGVGSILLRKSKVRSACAWWQVAGMGLAAAMLALPIARPASWSPELTYAILLGLFAAQTIANVALWRVGDEMLRRVIMETGAVCFWVLQAALFLYAAAERLGLVPGVTAWGMIGVLMAVYFVASCIVAARRGYT